jgi:(1->4)-alpha-D-glucan 1-alpha-D-glucosylmutase
MQALHFRHQYAALFRDGEYLKINVQGSGADRLLAFARQDQDNFAVIVVPRLLMPLADTSLDDAWADTWLELPQKAPRQYQELFSQCRVTVEPCADCVQLYVRESLKRFPLAILSGVVE